MAALHFWEWKSILKGSRNGSRPATAIASPIIWRKPLRSSKGRQKADTPSPWVWWGIALKCCRNAPAGFTPDLLTDQTSAHDPLNGYIPAGISLEDAAKLRREDSGNTCAGAWIPLPLMCARCWSCSRAAPSLLITAITSADSPESRRQECSRFPRLCPRIHTAAVL